MELAILAGLGALGYRAAKAKQATTPQPAFDYTLKNDAPTQALWRKQYRDMLNPIDTGIVPPNNLGRDALRCPPGLPFASSSRTQNTNTAFKQARMEMFTGNLDRCRSKTGTYAPKREVAALFKPQETAQPLTSLGTSGNPQMPIAAERYYVSGTQNGVGPTDKIQVGPGLGLGPNQQSGGNFHPYFRILPNNTNEYRLNRGNMLPTRPGGSDGTRLEAPPLIPNTSANRQSQRPDMHRPRDMLPTSGGGLQGPVQRPYHHMQAGNDLVESYVGGVSGGINGSNMGLLRGSAQPVMDRNPSIQGKTDQQMEPQILNLSGPQGLYADPKTRLSARPHAQQLPVLNLSGGPNNNNAAMGTGANQQSYQNALRPTDRHGVMLPLGMPSKQSSVNVRPNDYFAQQAKPPPDRVGGGGNGDFQRQFGNPSVGFGGALTPQEMQMKSARPVVSYTPGAQNAFGNPTPNIIQHGGSARDKPGGREAYLMEVNQGALDGGIHASNQMLWALQPKIQSRDREVWQRPLAPAGGLLAA